MECAHPVKQAQLPAQIIQNACLVSPEKFLQKVKLLVLHAQMVKSQMPRKHYAFLVLKVHIPKVITQNVYNVKVVKSQKQGKWCVMNAQMAQLAIA